MSDSRADAAGRADGWLLFGAAAGLTIGQLVPGDAASLAAGSGLPQVALWLTLAAAVSWLKPGVSGTVAMAADRAADTAVAVAGRWGAIGVARTGWALWGGLLLWLGLSALAVDGHGNLRLAINYWWQWVGMTATAYVLWSVMGRCRGALTLLPLMIGLACASSAQGIYQVQVSLPRDQARYRLDPDRVLAEAGLVAPAGSSARLLFESRLFTPDALGPFALGNSLGGLLMIWLLVLVGLSLALWGGRGGVGNSVRAGGQAGLTAAGLGLIALLLLVGLFLSGSRTAWLSVFVGFGLWLLWLAYRRGGWRRCGVALAWGGLMGLAVAVGGWLGGWAEHPRLSGAVTSAQFRWQYWQASARMLSDRPWLGVGPGNFQGFYPRYKLESASETVIDPHNFWVETWATGGVPAGGLLLAVLVLGGFVAGRRLVASQASPREAVATEPEGANRSGVVGAADVGSGKRSLGGVVPAGGWAVPAGWVSGGSLAAAALLWLTGGVLGDPPAAEDWWWAGALGLLVLWAVCRWLGTSVLDVPGRLGQPRGGGGSIVVGTWLAAAGWIASLCGLLHLLASGGWLAPGCTNSLSLLGVVSILGGGGAIARGGAAGATGVGAVGVGGGSVPGVSTFGGGGRFLVRLAPLAWLLVLAAFLWTAWMPALAIASWQRRVLTRPATSLDGAMELAERAVAADRLAPQPRLELARLRAMQLVLSAGGGAGRVGQASEVSPQALERFEEAVERYLAVDSASWVAWQAAGELTWGLPLESRSAAARAIEYFREALVCYPSNAALLVQAAAVAAVAEQWSEADRWASEAERLERANTHLDRALAYQSVFVPLSSLRLEWLRGIMGRSVDDRVPAEPLLAAVRSRIDASPDR
jgi:O-antigen ligase